jgi:hypothetical protein
MIFLTVFFTTVCFWAYEVESVTRGQEEGANMNFRNATVAADFEIYGRGKIVIRVTG